VPRIDAPTVAEHRARQRRAILDAARSHLAATGTAPSLAAVGAAAGLARSSVYLYFSSREDLMAAVVDEVLPQWASAVAAEVAAAPTPGEKVWAYVRSNVELFHSSEQAVATALTEVVEPTLLAGPMAAFHAELQEPLLAALRESGEPYPEVVAELVGSLTVKVTHSTAGASAPLTADQTLALLRRLLAGYLGLPEEQPEEQPVGEGR